MRIHLNIEGAALTATLDDTPPARDFAALLPLELSLDDYDATEKIADLPRELSSAGVPRGTAAAAGDVSYYAPWGNLALFYESAAHAVGLVRLGRFDALDEAIEVLRRPAPLHATIEIAET